MSTKVKVGIATASLLVSFAFGRFLTPAKVVIETKIVEVEKKEKKTVSNKKRRVTTVVITKPDGSKEEHKTVDTDANTNTDEKSQKDRAEQTKKETVSQGGKVSLYVLGGAAISPLLAPTFGLHVSTQTIGPISVGAWGLSNISGGISLGVTF